MKSADLTVAIGLSQGYRDLLRVCLSTIPAEVRKVISWYGPGEPEELPPNTVLVRPRRHSDNYMRGYVMNVAIRAVDTPYVLLGDADLAFPRYLVDVLSPTLAQVLRFYVGRVTPSATREILSGVPWETLFADSQGQHNRVFRLLYGPHNPCLYPTHALHQLRGYDESFVGWGREDDDLHARGRQLGLCDVREPLIVARLDDSDIHDYASYERGTVAPINAALWTLTEPRIVNMTGWGDRDSKSDACATVQD